MKLRVLYRRPLPATLESAKLKCAACPLLVGDVCMSPHCGCWKDSLAKSLRVKPWEKLKRCPERLW